MDSKSEYFSSMNRDKGSDLEGLIDNGEKQTLRGLIPHRIRSIWVLTLLESDHMGSHTLRMNLNFENN
jgi:hypothetical protein